MKKIPLKNYMIITLLFGVLILLSIIIRNVYNDNKTKDKMFIAEINVNELDNYLKENPDVLIYLSNRDNDDIKLEKKLDKYLTKNNISKNLIVYIDLNKVDNSNVNSLSRHIDSNLNYTFSKFDNVMEASNGTISDVMYYNEQDINYDDMIKFIKKSGVVNR